ncbi:MAG: hypothetical protein KatS3mg077_1108 [Candidatus Binatia bacterium]|nr:MAG: hypothetical protein KatS3mg077_1108 [Candidatus Binatia bacterium]
MAGLCTKRLLFALVTSVAALLVVGSCLAEEPFGPLPVRNFQPLRQVFFHFPFAAAKVPEAGALWFDVESAESNVIATDQGATDALLKFEQNRTNLRARLGLPRRWLVAVEVPLLSRFGGFLDPLIDTTEDLFSASNPERRLFPNNAFGGFQVVKGGRVLFHGPRQYLELGDLAFETQAEIGRWAEPLRVAARLAVEVPTGRTSAVWGSGTTDLGVGLALDYRLWSEHLWIFVNVAGIFPVGRVTAAELPLDPFLQQGLAFEWRAGRNLSLLLQEEVYTSPFRGVHSAVLEGTIVELSAGAVYKMGPGLLWLGGIENVSGVAQAADFTLMLGYRFAGPSLSWSAAQGRSSGF